MYWTHLIFVLLHGVLISWRKISASKPGYLDFDNLPETNFSCDGKVIGGYYADVETGCQMFHVCTIGQKGEVTDIKFLCLNGTVFDQETRVCERIDEVDCSKSEDFFGLNLELYGNNANFGIQPENEFECEDCSTDQTGDDEYEESEETTTYTTSTTTTTTTTTTPKPTTTTTTTARPTSQYHTSSQDTIAALLALHNAFNQGLQGSKVKAPPPRVINNAFSPTKPTIKPYSTYPTQRSNVNLNFKSHYTPDSQSYGSLNLQQRERPYYFTPATEKSNYHHFHSGDTSFGHSFDVTRPYNFQYFHSRKIPEKASVSVVTSTSTSTSVKTSKPNATEFPTGYDDYQDDIQDSFFDDVPKLRQKRELHPNHKYDEEITTVRYKNHKYDDEPINGADNDREQFLQNLLGSIDLEDNVREKMTDFFKKEEEEMDNMKKTGSFTTNLGNKIGQIFLQELNMTDADQRKSRSDKLLEWRKHFEDMKRDISLNYTFETNLNENDSNKLDRQKRDTRRVSGVTNVPPQTNERNPARRTNIDTEKFHVETRRGRPGRDRSELIPVSEAIEDDFTTIEYRKTSKRVRSQPRSTTSLRGFKYNYETTSALPESIRTQSRQLRRRPLPSKEARDFVHEDSDHLVTTIRYNTKDIQSKETRIPSSLPKETKRLEDDDLKSVTPSEEFKNEELRPLYRQTSVSSLDAEKNLNHDERFKTDSNHQRTREPVLPQARTPPYNPLFSREERREFEPRETTPALPARDSNRRRKVRVKTRIESSTPTTSTTIIPRVALTPDPEFDCEGKVKGGFYADIYNECRAFFICSQGEINGPLLKSHFACGDKTKFNQRSRTCQAEDQVECSISKRYYHLNNDFLVPDTEDKLRGSFEPMKVR